MVTFAQTKLARVAHRDVWVVARWEVTIETQKAVALIAQVKITLDLDGFGADWLVGVDLIDLVAIIALWAIVTTTWAAASTAAAVAVTKIAITRITVITVVAVAKVTVSGIAVSGIAVTRVAVARITVAEVAVATIIAIITSVTAALRSHSGVGGNRGAFVFSKFYFPLSKGFTVGTQRRLVGWFCRSFIGRLS